MSAEMHATKLVVRDLDSAERFYRALGLQVVSRNVGGEDEVRQAQCGLAATSGANAHLLILSQFLELPPAPRPVYPGEIWLALRVADVDATIAQVEALGGTTVRPGQDRPEHDVRAAVVADPEGHIIELVGPLVAR